MISKKKPHQNIINIKTLQQNGTMHYTRITAIHCTDCKSLQFVSSVSVVVVVVVADVVVVLCLFLFHNRLHFILNILLHLRRN